nr:PKD domain-containing protein [Bacteroidota bacterium]
ITHSVNGFFGFLVDAEIDNHDGYGYALLKKWGVWDTLFFMTTINNFQSIELQNVFIKDENPLDLLCRGVEEGELYSFIENTNCMIRYCNDYGYSWITKNQLFFNNYSTIDFTGGRQQGELYLLVTYIQLMGQIKHVFVYHSLDYGEVFTVYHPFAYGTDPFYVAFEADTNIGVVPLTIQFIDESSGEGLSWEWDFDNDGTIDSYEQNPTFIYNDTGYYDVELTVTNPYNQYSLIKEDFILVQDTTTSLTDDILQDVRISPNPLNDRLRIDMSKTSPELKILIYSSIGEKIFETKMCQNPFEINFTNYPKGIYIINIKDHIKSINYKIIKK